MVVYWDLLALWDFVIDYLLLLGTARLAGRAVPRARLAVSAAFGAAYSLAALALRLPAWTIAAAMCAMCALAFAKTGRRVKLTLLFALLACALGGGVLLLGRTCGGMERLARGIVYARLPWGVFFTASGLSYLLLTLVFHGDAKHGGGEFVRACIEYGGRQVEVRLFRDTGNALTDPLTGEGVPVIEKNALLPLFERGNDTGAAYNTFTTLRAQTAGGDTVLEAFRCDKLTIGGRSLGARLIALSPETFGGAYQGLWFDEEREETERHELEATVG